MKAIQIAVIGTGFGAKVALPVYARLDQFEPVGVWSRSADRASAIGEQFALPIGTSDLDQVLAIPGLEAVHIAGPVSAHREMVERAAERGLHVLCEKPMGRDLAEGQAIVEAIRRAGVVGMVDFELRFRESRQCLIEKAREVVGSVRLASISLVQSDHATESSRPYTWVSDSSEGGGRIQAYGVHDLDLLFHLFPDIEGVGLITGIGVPRRRSSVTGETTSVTAEDAYAILVRFANGGMGVVSLVSTARHARGDRIELYGDRGSALLDSDGLVRWGTAGEDLQVAGPFNDSFDAAFEQVARRFWSSIRESSPPDPSLEEAIGVHVILDSARRMARSA